MQCSPVCNKHNELSLSYLALSIKNRLGESENMCKRDQFVSIACYDSFMFINERKCSKISINTLLIAIENLCILMDNLKVLFI